MKSPVYSVTKCTSQIQIADNHLSWFNALSTHTDLVDEEFVPATTISNVLLYAYGEVQNNIDIDALVRHANNIDWAPLFSADCIDKKVDFYGQINDSL